MAEPNKMDPIRKLLDYGSRLDPETNMGEVFLELTGLDSESIEFIALVKASIIVSRGSATAIYLDAFLMGAIAHKLFLEREAQNATPASEVRHGPVGGIRPEQPNSGS
jgi:hypothetical protein